MRTSGSVGEIRKRAALCDGEYWNIRESGGINIIIGKTEGMRIGTNGSFSNISFASTLVEQVNLIRAF